MALTVVAPVGRLMSIQSEEIELAGAIVPGDVLSDTIEFDLTTQLPNGTGLISQFDIVEINGDVAPQKIELDLFLSKTTFSATQGGSVTYPTSTDDIIGIIPVVSADYSNDFSNIAVAKVLAELSVKMGSTRILYGVIISRDTLTVNSGTKILARVHTIYD